MRGRPIIHCVRSFRGRIGDQRRIGLITERIDDDGLRRRLRSEDCIALRNSRRVSMMTMNVMRCRGWCYCCCCCDLRGDGPIRRILSARQCGDFSENIFLNDGRRRTRTDWRCVISRDRFVTENRIIDDWCQTGYRSAPVSCKVIRKYLPDIRIELPAWNQRRAFGQLRDDTRAVGNRSRTLSASSAVRALPINTFLRNIRWKQRKDFSTALRYELRRVLREPERLRCLVSSGSSWLGKRSLRSNRRK